MSQKKALSILEFSRLTGIKRENLRFYDRIGLLSPETRGDNRYRYYSRRQLSTAYLIGSLRGLGVGLDSIKSYAKERTPEKMLELFALQDASIQAEIERLQEVRDLMAIYSDMAREALSHEKEALFLEEKAPESIFLCPPIPSHLNDDEGEIFSYEYAKAQDINPSYPLGTYLPEHVFETGDVNSGLRYYFKASGQGNAEKPAGRYAVAYGRCDPWQSRELYLRLLQFIQEQGLVICGPAYEEYPLNDMAVQDSEAYCVRVEIPVRVR